MKKYKLILADADGTLLDFDKTENVAIINTFCKFSVPTNKENIERYVKVNISLWKALERGEITQTELRTERFRKFLALSALDESMANKMSETFILELMKGHYLIEGAMKFINEARKSAPLAIITNGITKVQKSRLDGCGLRDNIDGLYISEEVGAAKPDPKMIFDAMKDFSISNKSEVLVIGDSQTSDIKAALNAGVDSVFVSNMKSIPNDSMATYNVSTIMEVLNIIR